MQEQPEQQQEPPHSTDQHQQPQNETDQQQQHSNSTNQHQQPQHPTKQHRQPPNLTERHQQLRYSTTQQSTHQTEQEKQQPPNQTSDQAPAAQPAVRPVGVVPMMSDTPEVRICPKCGKKIFTVVKHTFGTWTWIVYYILLLLYFPYSCIPFCLNDCKDAHHVCPSCGALVGVYRRL